MADIFLLSVYLCLFPHPIKRYALVHINPELKLYEYLWLDQPWQRKCEICACQRMFPHSGHSWSESIHTYVGHLHHKLEWQRNNSIIFWTMPYISKKDPTWTQIKWDLDMGPKRLVNQVLCLIPSTQYVLSAHHEWSQKPKRKNVKLVCWSFL